jgi:hypothetical protein
MMVILLQDVGENHCHFLPLKTDTAQCEAKGFRMQLIVKMQAPMHTRMEERRRPGQFEYCYQFRHNKQDQNQLLLIHN